MNRKQKKILTVAAGIANLSFTLTVAATATYAWFRENRRVSATGMSVQCAVPDSKLTWEILRYDDDLKSGISSDNVLDYYLDPYDQYITSRNIHSNVLLKATMTFDDGDLFTSGDQLYVDIKCGNETVYDGDKHVRSLTSNIAQFKATVGSYYTAGDPTTPVVVNESIDETSANTRYNTATNYFKSKKSSTAFLTVNNQTPNKVRRHQITLIPQFDCGNSSVKKLVTYIECSYKQSLVDFYLNSWGASLSGEIDLSGDIIELNFRIGKSYSGAYVQVTDESQLTSGDYLIGYSEHNAAMDGSLTNSGDTNMDSACNYIPVESKKGRIANTETTYNSRYAYNTDTKLLRSASGYNITDTTSDTGGGLTVNTSSDSTNELGINNSEIEIKGKNGHYLRYNSGKNSTRFRYYSSNGNKAVQLYKYDANAVANVELTSITVSGNYNKTFYLGDEFTFGDGVITAYYSDNTHSSISASECVFSGYNGNALGNQVITVTYTEDDIVKSTTYSITVKNEPYVTLDYTTLKGTVGGSVTIVATAHNFDNSVSWNWTTSDSSKVTVTPDSTDSNKAVIGYIGITTDAVIVTVTATDSVNNISKYQTCSVTVLEAGTGDYKKVTSNLDDWSGEYLIVYEGSSLIFDGSLTKLDVGANTQNVTISNNTISSSYSAYQFIIEPYSTGYSIKSASGYYIGDTGSDSKGLNSSTSCDYINTISYENGNILITGSNGPILRYNASSTITANKQTGLRFRYYKSTTEINDGASTNTKTIYPIQLYKRGAGEVTKSVSRIEVTNANKTEYFTDDTEFVTPTVVAYYDNATSEDVTNKVTLSGNDLTTAGAKTVTVSYTENGVTVETTYNINVTQSLLTGISVSNPNTVFYEGDTFEFGGKCTATYSSGKTKEVTPTSFTGNDTSIVGEHTVTVKYTEGSISQTATYTMEVKALELTGLSVKTAPTKTIYNKGDTFSSDGTTLTASFNNGARTKDLTTGFTNDKTSPLTTSDTKVTFSYTYKSVTKTCEQAITVKEQTVKIQQNSNDVTTVSGVAEDTIEGLTAVAANFSGKTLTYTWTSSDAATVTVEPEANTAVLYLYKAGTANITCTVSDGSQSASATITITVEAITISISEDSITLVEGDSKQLTGSSNSAIKWTSSDTSIATVDQTGKVTSVGAGTCTITATAGTGANQVSDTCTITVSELHEITITPDGGTTAVYVNETLYLEASCSTSSCSITSWQIISGGSYASLVEADNIATITGVTTGDVVVRATCAHGNYAEITINVITSTDHTYTWTAKTANDLGKATEATVTLNKIQWNISTENDSRNFFNGCVQVGANGKATDVTLSTSQVPGIIKSVYVECGSYRGIHTIEITVGNTTYLPETSTCYWTGDTGATSSLGGTGTSSGEITIYFIAGTSARALFIKSITIVYNN